MSTRPLADWPHWRDRLIAQLRKNDVPGDRIGEILMEVEAHLQDSGEDPDDAFGNPVTYADARAGSDADTTDEDWWQALAISLVALFGVILLASGAQGLGQGTDAVGPLDSWFALPAGALVLLAGVWWLPQDDIRNPRTDKPLFGDSAHLLRIVTIALLAVVALAFYALGRLLQT